MTSLAETSTLMGSREAADYLGRSRGTLNGWRWKGRGPAYHVRMGRIYYEQADLDAWVASQSQYIVPTSVAS